MSNFQHYNSVKPLKMTRIPRVFLSLVALSQPDRKNVGRVGTVESVLKSYSIGEYERVINTYRCNKEITDGNYETTDSLYSFIKQSSEDHGGVWIICNGVSRCFSVLQLWDKFDNEEYVFKKNDSQVSKETEGKNNSDGYIAIGGQTEIISYFIGKSHIRCVSTTNYGNTTIAECLHQSNDEIDAINCRLGEYHDLYPDALTIQRSIASWYKNMLLQWRKNDLGIWKTTSSQLSHSIYRRKFLKTQHTNTRNESLDRLERASVFGGRAEVYYGGDICKFDNYVAPYIGGYVPSQHRVYTDKIVRLDISSMYPFIFSQYEVPGFCIYHKETNDIAILENACKSNLIAIAAVRLNTNIPEFPVRIQPKTDVKSEIIDHKLRIRRIFTQSSVEFGTGEFDTVLIGPELELALELGIIKELREIAIYTKSDEYMEFMQYLINKRLECKISKDKYNEKLWKLMANSFGGKLAQRNSGWEHVKDMQDAVKPWGEWYIVNADTGELMKYRAIAKYIQKWKSDSYTSKGRPAVWSMICSIGRFIMYSIRKLIPMEYLYQQDTDGLYVSGNVLPILEKCGIHFGDCPGQIRIVSSHNHIRFWGPRHYVVDGEFVMSGLTTGFVHLSGDNYFDRKEVSLASGRIDKAPSSITIQERRISLSCNMSAAKIGANGYFSPFVVSPQSKWLPFALDNMGKLFRDIT